jgi:hypothetical protein
MKKLLIGLCALCALAVSAAENPMNTVRTTKNVEELPAVLQAASAEITLQSPENRRVDLCVAYGLAYLRSTDVPTFDAYIKVVQDKAIELKCWDACKITGNVFEVLRPWWIGEKFTKALTDPAIEWIAANPHVNLYSKAAILSYDHEDYAQAVSWWEKRKGGSAYAIIAYAKLGQLDAGIDYFYSKLGTKEWSPESGVNAFKKAWELVLEKSKSDPAVLDKYKKLNATYASMYTNYLYDASDPAKSPWRPLVTLLTAQSK